MSGAARVGRIYLPDETGGGVYYLDTEGGQYCLCHHACFTDGRVDWAGGGEVDFFGIEEELQLKAREAGRVLCKRHGLTPWETARVLHEPRINIGQDPAELEED